MDMIIASFQGIMLFILYVTLIIRSIILYIKEGINPLVLGKGKKGFHAALEYFFLGWLLVWSYEIVATVFTIPFHFIPVPGVFTPLFNFPPVVYIGMVLSSAGYIIFVLSLIFFGSSWRVGIDKENAGKLVTGGIFSMTRNPIYLYIDLYSIGTAFINRNIFFIGVAVFTVIGLHFQILYEEKFLETEYGNEYKEYKKRYGGIYKGYNANCIISIPRFTFIFLWNKETSTFTLFLFSSIQTIFPCIFFNAPSII
jgi:protein-S-isoprenylcysteine O-methyltransferase Ste14